MRAARPTAAVWGRVVRLGLVQAALGAVVVLVTSTLNRVMVVELGLPAALPGALVALHFAVQAVRPGVGFGSDRSGRRVPWILGGLAVAGLGATLAVALSPFVPTHTVPALLGEGVAFALLGVGLAAAGTPLLALLTEQVPDEHRPRAAAIAWIMMIAGFVVTALAAGFALDPFSTRRFVLVTAGVALTALLVSAVALRGFDRDASPRAAARDATRFGDAWRTLWTDPTARHFAGFVFLAMLAFSAQEIILEPFAGAVFGLTPGESTRIAGAQNGGMLVGMIGAAVLARRGTLAAWARWGCVASALAFGFLALTPMLGGVDALRVAVPVLGAANGAFAIGALGGMMRLAGADPSRVGLRMGLFGAAQALAYGLGGLAGAGVSDLARWLLDSTIAGYGVVFVGEGVLFLAAALLVPREPRASAVRVLGPTPSAAGAR